MKKVVAAGLALAFNFIGPGIGFAQVAAPPTAAPAPTPTTKILGIGTINPGVDRAKVFAILPDEVRETVNLYLDGKIDQWYSQQNGKGVVFILNVTDLVTPCSVKSPATS